MYSRPASPRPTRSPVRGTAPTLTTAVEDSQPKLRSLRTPLQAQGRNVVSRDGQRGVMSDRNRFQPLGTAALNRLGGDPGNSAEGPGGPGTGGGRWPDTGRSLPANGFIGNGRNFMDTRNFTGTVNNRPGVFGIEAGAGVGAGGGTSGGGDIQTAIQGLKSQLGMPAGTDADTNTFNKMAGFGPNVQGMGPAAEAALAGANGGNPNFAPSMPPDVASRLRSMIGGGLQAPTATDAGEGAAGIRPNIRPEIVRDVMQGAGAGGAGSGGMAPFGGGGRGAGAGAGAGGGAFVPFMPGQPNPYAEILRQRLGAGAGAGAGGGGGMAGQYAY